MWALPSKIQLSSRTSVDWNFVERKHWPWSLLMSSLLSVKVSSWLCVNIRFAGQEMEKLRTIEREPRGLHPHEDDFSWVLTSESGN